jgi:hypothetical protein
VAINNPWKISLGLLEVGGTSDTYLLNGPYVIEIGSDALRLVFEVVVVATSYDELATLTTTLEESCSARDIGFTIDLDGNTQPYLPGSNLLNPTARITKRGDIDTDRGFSRSYTITLDAGRPAIDSGGLRSMQAAVSYDAARRPTVTVSGQYTTSGGSSAEAAYMAGGDGVMNAVVGALGGSWELLAEDYGYDRNNHLLNFQRVAQKVMYPEAKQLFSSPLIQDTRISFRRVFSGPGDSIQDTARLGRVVARVETWVNFDETDGVQFENDDPLQDIYNQWLRDHLIAEFEANFVPQVLAVEAEAVSFERSEGRITAELTILFQVEGGSAVVEVLQARTYSEARTIDYTPVHADGPNDVRELAAFADPGWLTVLRTTTRTVRVVGDETPKFRLAKASEAGLAGAIEGLADGTNVKQGGWNVIQNTSQVTPQHVGIPSLNQVMKVTTLTETVVERFTIAPEGTSSGGSEPLEPPTNEPSDPPTTGASDPLPGATGNTNQVQT